VSDLRARFTEIRSSAASCAHHIIAFICDDAQGDALGMALHDSFTKLASAEKNPLQNGHFTAGATLSDNVIDSDAIHEPITDMNIAKL
jgi:hypothetical protein